jgi:apolipoprotein N-acyltransferase
MFKRIKNSLNYFISLCIVALGQPARASWLGAIAAIIGFSLFFLSISPWASRLKKFIKAVIWFTTVQLVQLSWMTSIEYQGYYILFIYFLISLGLGCQFGLLTLFVFNKEPFTIRKMLFCASFWTLMEWVRLLILCGFSWNPIGLALTSWNLSLQFASLFGVLGLSFWVMLTNLIGLKVLQSRIKRRSMACWLIVALVPYLFGILQLKFYQHASRAEKRALDVALIQTDLLPSEKTLHFNRVKDFISPFEQWGQILQFLKEKQKKHWDFIVLPEAAVPLSSDLSGYPYVKTREIFYATFGPESEKKFPPLCAPFAELRDYKGEKTWCVSNLFWCQTLANLYSAEVIAGLDHSDPIAKKNFNSLFYFKPNSLQFQRYDKQILLPLAEYLPLDVLKPLTKSYGIYDFFSPGEGAKIFGNHILFSPSICYEETFSEVMRKGRVKGAELFVNVTNDNYYPDSSLHAQHLYHSRLRAVENGIPLIRACNSGGTAVIDCFGQLLAQFEPVESERSSRKRAGVLSCHFNPFHFPTLFSVWGDSGIIALCCFFVFYHWRMGAYFIPRSGYNASFE